MGAFRAYYPFDVLCLHDLRLVELRRIERAADVDEDTLAHIRTAAEIIIGIDDGGSGAGCGGK